MLKKKAALLPLLLVALLLSACYDAHEPNELLHIWAVGVDRGIADKWRLTLKFSAIEELSGASDEPHVSRKDRSQKGDTVTIDSPSFFGGIDLLNASLPRRLSFNHSQTIVFSEEIARSGLVGNYIMPINRFRQMRKSATVLVVKGTAEEFLKAAVPFAGSSISEDLQLHIKDSENTALYPNVTLEHFYTALHSPFFEPIATLAAVNDFSSFPKEGEPWGTEYKTGGQYTAGELPRSGDNEIELLGTALFRGDTMVGELNGGQTRFLLMARGEFKRAFFTVQDPKEPDLIIPLDVRAKKKPLINVDLSGDRPRIDLKVRLDLDLLAVQSKLPYERDDLRALLEKEFAQSVKEGIEAVIQICQNLNVDAARFGEYATKLFLTIQELEDYNWNSRFQDAEIRVEVQAIIRRTGRQVVL